MEDEQVNIHEAKTHLSRLVERAAAGHEIVISKRGRPVAKLTRLDKPRKRTVRRIGFMEGQLSVPDDFDTMAQEEIEAAFYGSDG